MAAYMYFSLYVAEIMFSGQFVIYAWWAPYFLFAVEPLHSPCANILALLAHWQVVSRPRSQPSFLRSLTAHYKNSIF